jgi:hypothetical protein
MCARGPYSHVSSSSERRLIDLHQRQCSNMIRRPPGAELLPRYPPWVSCPVAQTVDITPFNTTLVPASEDQAPLIEQINQIMRHVSETVKYQKESETICRFAAFGLLRLALSWNRLSAAWPSRPSGHNNLKTWFVRFNSLARRGLSNTVYGAGSGSMDAKVLGRSANNIPNQNAGRIQQAGASQYSFIAPGRNKSKKRNADPTSRVILAVKCLCFLAAS